MKALLARESVHHHDRQCANQLYFQNEKKLTPKQAQCQDFFPEFDYVMEYKPGKENAVTDALSQNAMPARASSIASNLLEWVKEHTQ